MSEFKDYFPDFPERCLSCPILLSCGRAALDVQTDYATAVERAEVSTRVVDAIQGGTSNAEQRAEVNARIQNIQNLKDVIKTAEVISAANVVFKALLTRVDESCPGPVESKSKKTGIKGMFDNLFHVYPTCQNPRFEELHSEDVQPDLSSVLNKLPWQPATPEQ